MKSFRPLLATAALLLTAGGGASADLLVTKDGSTIETAGPWRVDGRRVLFTLPNGQLSSLRADDVDLDASALATARAAEAAAATPEPAPQAATVSILTLTEDDLAKDTGEEGEAEAKKETDQPAPNSPLQIASWEQMPMPDGDGVQIFGVVKNVTKNFLTSVNVTAILYGAEGGMLANGDAQLNKTSIGPDDVANFRIEFPGLPDFAAVKFDATARGFDTNPVTQGAEEDIAPEGAAEEPPPAEQTDAQREREAIRAYNENMKASGTEPQAAPEPEPEPQPEPQAEPEPAENYEPPPARG